MKGTSRRKAARIDLLRIFLGTIDGLLYFVLNSSAKCPRGDEDELPLYWRRARPSRTQRAPGWLGLLLRFLGEISWQPCNYLLVGIVQQSVCSRQMLPSWSPSSLGTPICEVWGHIVQQPNSEFSVSKMIWNTEALMTPHLSPKATPTEGGSRVNCASVSKLKALGLCLALDCKQVSLIAPHLHLGHQLACLLRLIEWNSIIALNCLTMWKEITLMQLIKCTAIDAT